MQISIIWKQANIVKTPLKAIDIEQTVLRPNKIKVRGDIHSLIVIVKVLMKYNPRAMKMNKLVNLP